MDYKSDAVPEHILAKLHALLAQNPLISTLWIAYSGGLDSAVLLHVIAASSLKKQFSIKAVHINHGINQQALSWAEHCALRCQELSIPLTTLTLEINKLKGESLEEKARQYRYQAFSHLLTPEAAILTAHHQDDQAETLLLRLLRGSGIRGLQSMLACRPLSKGWLMRPLLGIPRQALEDFAKQHQLCFMEDDSNQDEQYDRNFLRRQILPLLKNRWPSAAKTLSRSATICQQTDALLQELLEKEFEKIQLDQGRRLSISLLKQFPATHHLALLRYWMLKNDLSMPSLAQLEQIVYVLHSSSDKMPAMSYGNVKIRRYQDELYITPKLSHWDPRLSYQWNLLKPLVLPDAIGVLKADPVMGGSIKLPHSAEVLVKFRQGGERCRVKGRHGSHLLKKLFQEWGVPPWLRDQVPLIYYQADLIAVVGYCVCEPWIAQENEVGIRFYIEK